MVQKLKRDPNRYEFEQDNNGELIQIELDALQKSPEQFRLMVLEAVDGYYNKDISRGNLTKFTPEYIDELINAKIRLLRMISSLRFSISFIMIIIMSRNEKQTTIAIRGIHYNALLKLGTKNETFDHIVGNLLKNVKKDAQSTSE
ncbi:MAG: hypothetical protein WBE34_05730 [Candidatus Nitrosopolaris sp.]